MVRIETWQYHILQIKRPLFHFLGAHQPDDSKILWYLQILNERSPTLYKMHVYVKHVYVVKQLQKQ